MCGPCSGSREAKGAMAPGPIKISHKKMAAKGGHIDFMFLGPPYLTAGSATGSPSTFTHDDLSALKSTK